MFILIWFKLEAASRKLGGGLGGKTKQNRRKQTLNEASSVPCSTAGIGPRCCWAFSCTKPSLHVCTSELQTQLSLPIKGEIGWNKYWKHFIVHVLYSRVLLWELCPHSIDLEVTKESLQVFHYIIILFYVLPYALNYSIRADPTLGIYLVQGQL